MTHQPHASHEEVEPIVFAYLAQRWVFHTLQCKETFRIAEHGKLISEKGEEVTVSIDVLELRFM